MRTNGFFNKTATFEIVNVEASTAQLARNVEKFYDSAIILIGSNGELNYYNSHATELFELDAKKLDKDLDIFGLIHYLARRGDFGPGDPDQFTSIAAGLISEKPTDDTQMKQTYLTMPSGNILRVLIERNPNNTVTLTAQDVSEQRRNENMLEMALDIGFAGYLIFDITKQTCSVESRYMLNLLTSQELHTLETKGPSSLFHSDDLVRSQDLWNDVKTTGETQKNILRFVTQKEGVRHLRFVLMPESNVKNCNRIIAFFNDVTDMLRQQENLGRAKRLAEESLSAKENFLARMSHEIRTPMNAVIGMADAIIHHHREPEIVPKLELIQKSATSILKMLDETLTHSRLDTDSFSLAPAPASPSELIRDACAIWEQQALKNNSIIRCIIKENVPSTILFDKYRYEQCVNNLLSNAVKFTHGGKIEVILTVLEKPGQNPYLVLAVKDTGIGMTEEQQNRAFDAYAQADNSISSRYGGTGLGLNITKQIVKRMGGTISLRSKIGSGSMFAVTVPITDVNETSIEEASQDQRIPIVSVQEMPSVALVSQSTYNSLESEQIDEAVTIDTVPNSDEHESQLIINSTPLEAATSTSLIENMLDNAKPEATAYSDLRVLVVDDNPTNHLVVRSLLSSIVANISLANNGTEALKVLDSKPIDLVLMDIHMPIMDGIECTLAIRSSEKPWQNITIIALTADPQYQQTKLCKNIGMDEALAKPVRLNDLLQAIDTVLPKINSTQGTENKLPLQQSASA